MSKNGPDSPPDLSDERRVMLDNVVAPFVRERFEECSILRTAVLFVAQYWDDEANDAVHQEIAWSKLQTVDLDAALHSLDEWEPEPVNLSEDLSQTGIKDFRWIGHWDVTNTAIPLWACFCREDCDQNNTRHIFRRRRCDD